MRQKVQPHSAQNPATASAESALLKTKLQRILTLLNQGLVEREGVLKAALLTVLAEENLVLVGPPGTGKSLVARRIAQVLSNGEDGHYYFEYLLTKFSTPEELFGPLSISELKADRFKRNTRGYLPTVNVAFLDEIFKASSSILNALLTILNERIFHNGAQAESVPLQALIAASNELPTDDEALGALYDRFLVRTFVDYVSEENFAELFNVTTEPTFGADDVLSRHEIDRLRQAANTVKVPADIAQGIQSIWMQHKEAFKEDARETLSDRRLKKILKLLRVSAASNGRREVDLSDVLLLKDCLWNHPDNASKVFDIISTTLQSLSRPVPVKGSQNTPVYEVDSDGSTLVPVSQKTAVAAKPPVAKMGAVVKGFAGSGTASDPLLIRSIEDFLDLERPDVGQKGYHFRQTADLDFSAMGHWPNLNFKGHYDGAGFTLKGKGETISLLRTVQESSFTNLKLANSAICYSAEKTSFTACEATKALVATWDNSNNYCNGGSVSGCTLRHCQAWCMTQTATDSQIEQCQTTGGNLIWDQANNCQIRDCEAKLNEGNAGIAVGLQNSTVTHCVASGAQNRHDGDFLAGIACHCDNSTISHCATGPLSSVYDFITCARIACEVKSGSKLEHNISIEDNWRYDDDPNGPEGKTVAKAQWTQRYFELTLGWDFDTVWKWDSQNNQPTLQQVGVNALGNKPKAKPSQTAGKNTADLLTLQLQANLWI